MSGDPKLNGSDYLMLGFDHELRRHGFAGNSCQIALELVAPVFAAEITRRLAVLIDRHPILSARPGGLIFPRWKPAGRRPFSPQVRQHGPEPGLLQKLFNEPLAIRRGELLRFDLIERADGGMTLLFTWSHALMDAPGAEQFLAVVGHPELPLPAVDMPPPGRARLPLVERFKVAWKYLHHLDGFCRAAPRAMGVRHPAAPAGLEYRVEKFSAAETATIRANGARLCGVLGHAQFHAAAAVVELHRLHQRLGCPAPSYVLPVPVGLRPKGAIEPLFSNQLAMLMVQFLPDQLGSVAAAVDSLKTQTTQALRTGLLDSGVVLADLFRFLPLPVYMAILKQGLRGEICSFFYGDTAAVNPQLTSFLGVSVAEFTHVAPVTPAPGLGVIFYHFRGELRVTVLHSPRVLNATEAAGFSADLRARLLSP